MWFEIHYVASAQPWKVGVVLFHFIVLDLQEGLFSIFKFLSWS